MSKTTTGRMSLLIVIDDSVSYVKAIDDNHKIIDTTTKFSERLLIAEKGSGDTFYAVKLANKDKKIILNKEWETISVKV